ncbi:MAG: hypothetical protein ACWGHH_00360 [Sulfurovaceae bacterium]
MQQGSTSALLEAFQGTITQDALTAAGIYTSPYAYNDSLFSDYLFYTQDNSYDSVWEDLINGNKGIDTSSGNYTDWIINSGVFSDSYEYYMVDNYTYLNNYTFDSTWTYDDYLSNYSYDANTGFTYNYDFDYSYSDYGSYDYYGYDSFGYFFYPVVLDLDGDGVELTSVLDSTAWFDTEGDGAMHQSGWVGADDGLLAYDENGDGKITTAREIAFANRTEANDTDLEALRVEFDSNNDGKLDASDVNFDKFMIWQDKDSDGESDDGELLTLTQAGIASINLVGSKIDSYAIDGNKISAFTSYTRIDGTVGIGADVALGYDSTGYTTTTQTGYMTVKQMGGSETYAMVVDINGINLDLNKLGLDGAVGNNGNDYFFTGVLTTKNLIFEGGSGNDTLYGSSGNDWLSGGDGSDILSAGSGNDTLVIDALDKTYYGGSGYDTLILEGDVGISVNLPDNGIEAVFGSAGNDKIDALLNKGIFYSTTSAIIYGNDGDDTIIGSNVGDFISGGIGNDILNGSAGNDVYSYSRGDGIDTIKEYAVQRQQMYSAMSGIPYVIIVEQDGGNDTVQFGDDILLSDIEVEMSGTSLIIGINQNDKTTLLDNMSDKIIIEKYTTKYRTIENLQFSDGSIELLSSWKVGTSSDDILNSSASNERIFGNSGKDTLTYASSAKGVSVNLSIISSQDTVGGGIDTIVGIENITGSKYNDTLIGNNENNIINGGLGADSMTGGVGDDTYYVDNVSDIVAENVNEGYDGVSSSISYILGNNIEYLQLTGASSINGTGNNLNNTIFANSGSNTLNGGAGIDTLSYEQATAAIKVNLSLSSAQATSGSGTDTITGFESLTGSKYNDTLTGDSGNNTIDGSLGNDIIEGGLGNDTLNGGDGIDTLLYATASSAITVDLSNEDAQDTIGAGIDTITGFENLTGSNYNDTLKGNSLNNIMLGGLGNDALYSSLGNDTLNGGTGIDTVSYEYSNVGVTVNLALTSAQTIYGTKKDTLTGIENLTGSNYNDTLKGSTLVNIINGLDGDDIIISGTGKTNEIFDGGAGNDTLNGGAGIDTFVFKTTIGTSTTWTPNIDTITDFEVSEDIICLDNLVFKKLVDGTLTSDNFVSNNTGKAQDANDYIIYNKSNGSLYYDADGNGFGAAVVFATLANKPTDITYSDFVVV